MTVMSKGGKAARGAMGDDEVDVAYDWAGRRVWSLALPPPW